MTDGDSTGEQSGASHRPVQVDRRPLHKDEPQSLAELFLRVMPLRRRHDAIIYKREGEWRETSSTDFVERVRAVAAGLSALGLSKGDRVAIFATNCPEWTLVDAACQVVGIIDVPIYTTLSPSSIDFILKDSGARMLFIGGDEMLGAVEALEGFSQLEVCCSFQDGGRESLSLANLELKGLGLLAQDPHLPERLGAAVSGDDVATLIYTSGTTGEPKGVMLTHRNLISNAIDTSEHYGFTTDDLALSVLPLSHVFERSAMYLYLINGMRVAYAESIEKVADNLKEIRPTIFVGVPRIFEKVYARAKLSAAQSRKFKEEMFDWAISVAQESAMASEKSQRAGISLRLRYIFADLLVFSKLRAFFGGRLRFCITGGAALSDSIYLIFTGAGIPIMQGYGLTETSPVITSNNPKSMRLGTVGKPIREVSIRLADDGEIEIAGPNVMKGYFNRPEANDSAFTDDGWFRTGDIGTVDEDGFLRITDRKKELFKTSGGKYIAPAPIEQRIKQSRFVSQVVLVGNERRFAAALIVPNFDQLRSYLRLKNIPLMTDIELCADSRIQNLLKRQVERYTDGLAGFETVKKIRLIPQELSIEGGELTPTLKIKRRVVDEKYHAVIESMYKE